MKKVYVVCSDGPCGLNVFGAFKSKEKAVELRDKENETAKGWDKRYLWTIELED